jgi:hypothetical protein
MAQEINSKREKEVSPLVRSLIREEPDTNFQLRNWREDIEFNEELEYIQTFNTDYAQSGLHTFMALRPLTLQFLRRAVNFEKLNPSYFFPPFDLILSLSASNFLITLELIDSPPFYLNPEIPFQFLGALNHGSRHQDDQVFCFCLKNLERSKSYIRSSRVPSDPTHCVTLQWENLSI